ncbi:MAG: anhydro-N-acetylmuramic acid kinase [Rhodospirillales bacterium]|nr:anhydro-N-acetylmuramic acid kinase [Rhodospirillales bacterium]
MSEHKVYRAIGLMSGTSLDGEIDVALVETDGQSHVKPLGFYAHPYDQGVRDKVRACFGKRVEDAETREAEGMVTDLHIAAVKASGFEGDVVGFHGQTITHAPEDGFTWQLGDGARMAAKTGMDVICDFRSADIKAGGQGAPLAPLYHQARVKSGGLKEPVAIVNIGGVANVTYIDGEYILAFDTGPGNALMDDFIKLRTGQDYDDKGKIASGGDPDGKIIEVFLSDEYFSKLPPKSLDRAYWSTDLVRELSTKDGAGTLLAMTVRSIQKSFEMLPRKPKATYICGGGRKNEFLMYVLSMRLPTAFFAKFGTVEKIGWNGDAIEAECFGYMAVRSLLGLPLSLPETTGVARPVSGGVLHKP